MNYLLYKNSNWIGPFSSEEIKRMVGNGTTTIDDYVCLEDRISIYPIKAIPELFVAPRIPPNPAPHVVIEKEKSSTGKPLSLGSIGCGLIIVLAVLGPVLSVVNKSIDKAKSQNRTGSIESNAQISNGQLIRGLTLQQSGTTEDPVLEFTTENFGTIVEVKKTILGEGAMWRLTEGGETARLKLSEKTLEFIKANPNINSLTILITFNQPPEYENDRYGNHKEIPQPPRKLQKSLNKDGLDEWRKYQGAASLQEDVSFFKKVYYFMCGKEHLYTE